MWMIGPSEAPPAVLAWYICTSAPITLRAVAIASFRLWCFHWHHFLLLFVSLFIAIFNRNSSKKARCIGLSPLSQCCQVLSLDQIRAAAWDCVKPASLRARLICSGVGKFTIIAASFQIKNTTQCTTRWRLQQQLFYFSSFFSYSYAASYAESYVTPRHKEFQKYLTY